MTWPTKKTPVSAPPEPAAAANGHSANGVHRSAPPRLVRQASAPRRLAGKAVAVALALVVLGGVVTVVGVRAFSKRVTVLALAHDVQLGSPVTGDDLTTAEITSDPNLSPISASQKASVIGLVAATRLSAGSLLTRDQLTRGKGFPTGQVLVPLASKEGQLPAQGLTPGEKLLIVSTPAADIGGSTTGGSATKPPSTRLQGIVVDVGRVNPSTGVTVVDVRVPESRGVELAQIAASGGFELVALPAGR